MTWEPESSGAILEDLTVIRLFGETRRLYSHSFLQYGANYAERR